MRNFQWGLIFGTSIGVIIGVVLAMTIMYCIRYRRKHSDPFDKEENVSPRAERIPIRVHGADSSTILSDSNISQDSPRTSEWSNMPQWLEGLKRKSVASACGIPKYSYKELQKATSDFTTNIGEGAFGPVYKAQMATGQTVAVKVLAIDSKQGAMEFLSEVLLLGRLHHRNLVNLVGYSAERGQHMLVYVYMTNGSLASHLYNEKHEPLCWNLRVQIALDVARGLEYLHYGAFPTVVHRDIKSANILLDHFMKGRVADFGLSRQEKNNLHSSNVKGTFGYVDPEYMSTRIFTKKSDVYSFGVLLFEIMSGKNPQQGLMQYVEIVAINVEDNIGWEEIADSRLQGKFDVQQLNYMAALAYNCINPFSSKRPSMREIVLALSEICKPRNSRVHQGQNHPAKAEETTSELDLQGIVDPLTKR
ncbi:calcium/calmodulin-regulated receptor-like kinase 1 [Durio zibethinus]|uniref:Calcium/calmodulin-regulated receptor-like kinase 1 n=1 Tax=Durio zibethinus TaxID=66656 RepID=A0A6P5WJC7_DURZI|nr:calcium/calmodulin-regulated receptor-like kinase 1 [Durio zibethinus]XP_022716042.1 calcium/calmodulin-regulated receptor-like kinase 1 [Durio zibethinus]XP_022716043.1 calcium/calmodulin-regulated receptor-like kinase 1 [Durio zibethinus]XP_022716044.1 calcium/calmodulin-regulated receptor-like kinase 1 [Durio zibethinus]